LNKNQNNHLVFDQLNSDCHRYVTDICHRYGVELTPRQLKFIEIAWDKLKFTCEPFSRFDFLHIKPNNFSQIISRINKKLPLIEKVISDYPSFYSLNGLHLDKNVIEKRTRVNNLFINHRMEQLYNLSTKQPAQIHDIKLSSMTSQLYDNLLLQPDISPNHTNKQFVIPILTNSRFSSKAQISPNGRMDLHIGCSQLPIHCTTLGFSELIEYIGQVKEYLKNRANSDFIYQPAYDWVFEYYHFNRDSEPLIDPTYRFSVGDHFNYFYIKKLDNGKIVAREETKKTPKTKVNDEIENILKPTFQKASELERS
jgi:hypothetical protein